MSGAAFLPPWRTSSATNAGTSGSGTWSTMSATAWSISSGDVEAVEQLAHAAAEQRLGIAELHVHRHRRLQIGEQPERARLDRVGGVARSTAARAR